MYEVRGTILIIDDLRLTIDDSLTCALTRGSCEANATRRGVALAKPEAEF